MKKGLRLLVTEQCNFNCSYCCNHYPSFRNWFQWKWEGDVNYDEYGDIGITGGEPFLVRYAVYSVLSKTKAHNVYIYTNGILITERDIVRLKSYPNMKCLNVGLHSPNQIKQINERIGIDIPVRYMFENSRYDEIMPNLELRLHGPLSSYQVWTKNVCLTDDSDNDWIVLKTVDKMNIWDGVNIK